MVLVDDEKSLLLPTTVMLPVVVFWVCVTCTLAWSSWTCFCCWYSMGPIKNESNVVRSELGYGVTVGLQWYSGKGAKKRS